MKEENKVVMIENQAAMGMKQELLMMDEKNNFVVWMKEAVGANLREVKRVLVVQEEEK